VHLQQAFTTWTAAILNIFRWVNASCQCTGYDIATGLQSSCAKIIGGDKTSDFCMVSILWLGHLTVKSKASRQSSMLSGKYTASSSSLEGKEGLQKVCKKRNTRCPHFARFRLVDMVDWQIVFWILKKLINLMYCFSNLKVNRQIMSY
jgi:hypothetical protein